MTESTAKKLYVAPEVLDYGRIVDFVQSYAGSGGDFYGRMRPVE